MLTRILHNSETLITFIDQLNLKLSEPQRRHVINIADGVLVTDAPKTLAEIHRQFVTTVDVSNMADTFRIGPWEAAEIYKPVGRLLMQKGLERIESEGEPRRLLINIDDSLAIKDPYTRHLEGVDWHYDHAGNRRQRLNIQNALAYLSCNVVAGEWNFTFALHPYLRQRTVRRINRHRPKEKRLRFICKYRLARQFLADCHALIPKDVAVYVQFDAWYASAKLLNYIRRLGWHAICRVRSNRRLNGQSLAQHDLVQRHRRYDYLNIAAADGSYTTYLVRSTQGHLNRVPFPVRGLVSRRHYRDHLPVYFICTDLSLAPQQALQWYARRWNCEVDNWYLKLRLGLGDFRLQSYEAIHKYCAVIHLSWAYIQWRLACCSGHSQIPAQMIRMHRDEHTRTWLIGACQQVLASGDIEAVIQRFLPSAG